MVDSGNANLLKLSRNGAELFTQIAKFCCLSAEVGEKIRKKGLEETWQQCFSPISSWLSRDPLKENWKVTVKLVIGKLAKKVKS